MVHRHPVRSFQTAKQRVFCETIVRLRTVMGCARIARQSLVGVAILVSVLARKHGFVASQNPRSVVPTNAFPVLMTPARQRHPERAAVQTA